MNHPLRDALLIIHLLLAAYAQADTIEVGQFSSARLDNWEEEVFKGHTHYKIISLDNNNVLTATSDHSASGLFKKQQINLNKTPYLNWRWRIKNHLPALNEHTKPGDDYVARLYIVVDGGWAFWNTRAINYVWSSSQDHGSIWPNAFAGKNAMMLALRNQHDSSDTWFVEKRNIKQDFQSLFGDTIHTIDAIAIMTDTDNAGGQATSYYGDIYFTAD